MLVRSEDRWPAGNSGYELLLQFKRFAVIGKRQLRSSKFLLDAGSFCRRAAALHDLTLQAFEPPLQQPDVISDGAIHGQYAAYDTPHGNDRESGGPSGRFLRFSQWRV